LVERRKICDGWSRVANEWILIKESQARSFHFEHTTYSGRELKDRLVGAGFADVKLFGDLAGRPYRVSSGNGNLRTLIRVCLHSFKPANSSLPWLPKWTEMTFHNSSIRVPNVISGQIDVLPAQR
jgi:hypothetical protein